MKPQAWNELKRKAPDVLGKEVKAHEEKLWSLKVDLAAGKVKNVREIREVKKTIARIKGLLSQQPMTNNQQLMTSDQKEENKKSKVRSSKS